jgi:diguanylate cyclase (GGDEF)-like protein
VRDRYRADLVLVAALKRRSAAESQLALLASTDGLTGLSNRRRFDDVFAREWLRAQRTKAPIALLMIDADNFKAYNDAHGHQAGDAALASIAACIASSARRASDLCARYGGEEFAVLLPGETVEGAFRSPRRFAPACCRCARNSRDVPTCLRPSAWAWLR